MVESTPIIKKEQVSLNPTIGDKLKSAVGLGDTVRTATTIKGATTTTAPLTTANLAAVNSNSVPLARSGSASSLSSLSSVEDEMVGKEGLGSKLKRKLHVGHSHNTTTLSSATIAAPVVASSTTAAVITEAPVVTTKLHAPVVAEVQTQKNITIENREVITQNITKPVIEMHEKHVQRNVTAAPVMTQSVNPTLVQEIGRENLGFVAPIPKIETAIIDHGAKVQNIKAAPVLAEIHHKPVIERHEQVIIHENVNSSLTEIRTQPIIQNIYEKPTIVRTSETIIESAPTVVTAPVPVVAAVPVATQATVLHRSDSASSISSLSSVEDEAVGKESLGSKIKRKLHMGHNATTTTGTVTAASSESFTEKPSLKDRIKSKILHKNAPF